MKLKILPVFIPFAGCTQKCIFCNQPSFTNKTTEISRNSIVTQIEEYLGYSANWDQLAFYGGSFSCLSEEQRNEMYGIASAYGFHTLRFSTRPDCISDALVDEFLSRGVVAIELGVQSLNNRVLGLNRRTYQDVDVFDAIKILKGKFDLGIQVMPGLFGDSMDCFQQTVDRLLLDGISSARIYPTCVYESTVLQQLFLEKKYIPLTLAEAVMQTAYAYVKFHSSNIDVIRMGLPVQMTEPSGILVGPEHPAFGDLVKSYILLLFCFFQSKQGENVLLPTAFSGYKRIVRRSYDCFTTGDVGDIERLWDKIVRTVEEFCFEDNRWYLQREAVELAQKIERTANDR